MSSNTRPDADSALSTLYPEARVTDETVIYTYFTLPKSMKGLIPGWLWAKKAVNVGTAARTPSERPADLLFKEKSVDIHPFIDDLSRRGYKPFHIHVMMRENGNIRVRISWLFKPLEVLKSEEIDWVVMMFTRFIWDSMAHHNYGTEHLPEHIAINSAYPAERGEATCVQSVQIFKGVLSLLNDPDSGQNLVRPNKASKDQIRGSLSA